MVYDNADGELARVLAEMTLPPAELDRLLAELGDLPLGASLDDDDPLLTEAAAALGLL